MHVNAHTRVCLDVSVCICMSMIKCMQGLPPDCCPGSPCSFVPLDKSCLSLMEMRHGYFKYRARHSQSFTLPLPVILLILSRNVILNVGINQRFLKCLPLNTRIINPVDGHYTEKCKGHKTARDNRVHCLCAVIRDKNNNIISIAWIIYIPKMVCIFKDQLVLETVWITQ